MRQLRPDADSRPGADVIAAGLEGSLRNGTMTVIHRMQLVLLIALALGAGPCAADVFGYVDDQGVAHLSSTPLDERYILFKKEPQRDVPPQAQPPAEQPPQVTAAEHGTIAALRGHYAHLIARVAEEQRLDAFLLHAVITVESGYNARAKSPKGASGLMQLMPGTAERYGVTDVWNPLENLRAGARYLRDLLSLFNDDINLALAAYNAGEGAVMRYSNTIPPYAETRTYVPRVLRHYERYRAGPKL